MSFTAVRIRAPLTAEIQEAVQRQSRCSVITKPKLQVSAINIGFALFLQLKRPDVRRNLWCLKIEGPEVVCNRWLDRLRCTRGNFLEVAVGFWQYDLALFNNFNFYIFNFALSFFPILLLLRLQHRNGKHTSEYHQQQSLGQPGVQCFLYRIHFIHCKTTNDSLPMYLLQ